MTVNFDLKNTISDDPNFFLAFHDFVLKINPTAIISKMKHIFLNFLLISLKKSFFEILKIIIFF